jgi:phosphatidate cytidylyltransferase
MIDKKKMYTRTLTSVIFGFIVIFLLNYNYWTAFAFLILVSFLTTYEFLKIKLDNKLNLYLLIIAAFLFGSELTIVNEFWSPFRNMFYIISLIVVLLYHLFLLYGLFFKKNISTSNRIIVYIQALLYIGLPSVVFHQMVMKESNVNLVFIMILLIWTNDSFAYLTGSMFGKHKLMPSVSPGKTIEGFIGGGAFAVIASLIISFIYTGNSLIFYVILALIAWIIGTLGDLAESKIKRVAGIKDSGTIMPGHGGFLDRFDSYIFIMPWVVLLLYLMR